MAYSFLDLEIDVLKEKKIPLSVDEIWEIGKELDLTNQIGSKGKTPSRTIGARIYVDMSNQNSDFIKVGKRPTRFFLKSLETNDIVRDNDLMKQENDILQVEKIDEKIKERNLHPLLVNFIFGNAHFKCYSKTIYHESSVRKAKGYNKWLHPDIVGVYFPFDDYTKETQLLQESFKVNSFKLFSFEMKIRVTLANLREYYFQAVSNSSWANEGYLVTLEIDEDEDLMNELRRLNNSFGIGVIKLNKDEVESSEIILQARDKEFLDWDTIDRLVEENSDFKEFINDVMEDIKVKKVKSKYDKVTLFS